MINKQYIDDLREKRKIPKMEFYTLIGMTAKGYNQMFENDSMKISTLEKIAEVLGVPVITFFEQSPIIVDYQKKYIECLEENSRLKDEIRLLEKNTSIPRDVPISKLNT